MIRDPLMNQIARNMYTAYLVEYYQTLEDLIDREEPLSFEEWTKGMKELFENT